MLVRDMLIQAAERFPDREAIVDGERRLGYAEWLAQVLRFAGALSELGLRRGDRLAIGMRNSLEFATTFMACQVLGVGAVPFNIRLKAENIGYILANSGASVLVADDSIDAADVLARADLPGDLVWIDADFSAGGSDGALSMAKCVEHAPLDILPTVDHDDLSAIIYTSGTTGRPKGVPISQRNAHARLVTYVLSVGPTFDSDLRTFGAAPLYHTVGMHWVFLQTLYMNGTYYPVPKVTAESARQIVDERLTFLFGSPTLFKMLLEAAQGARLPSVRHISYGSAPAEPELLAGMYEHCPNASISEVYGTTELSIPFVTPSMRGLTPGVLRRTSDFRVRVVVPGGAADDVVKPGELGELLVHMGNEGVCTSYWGPDGDERLDAKLVGEWFCTGDGFRYDENGNFYFDGRLDDMFVSGGENIQPAEVENVLNGIPGVLDSAVVGVPDPMWSNVVTAFIVADERTLTAEVVDEYCRRSPLENYKRPRRVFFVEEIPRNPSGKIVRAKVKSSFNELITAAQPGAEAVGSTR